MSLPEDAAEVLDFWFNQLTPEEWFQPGDDLDEERGSFRAHSAAMSPVVSSLSAPVTCRAQ